MVIRRLMHVVWVASLMAAAPLAAQTAAADKFVPLVQYADTAATCEQRSSAGLQPDERGFLLRFAARDSVSRVVSAVWDTSGHLRSYSDARGDLRGPPVPVAERGPRTSILIDVVKGMALLLNEDHGKSLGSSMTTVNAAFASDRLGRPRELLARLHTQCGAPASSN